MSSGGVKAPKAKQSTSGENPTQARPSHKPVATHSQAEKRPNTEMDTSSFGDEITMINRQLEQLSDDTKQTKEKVKDMLSKNELKEFITTTVDALSKQLEIRLEKEIDKRVKEKTTEINDRIDSLTLENITLRERLEEVEQKCKKNEILAQKAMQKGNDNEQYSRKNNIKIMGVPELADETVEMLADHVCDIIHTKAGIAVDPRNIDAIHRIPGKVGFPKPVLMKMRNNYEKTKIMKKRKAIKEAGFRLVDDVTKLNTSLINRLVTHEHIDSAWFFNGSVYGKTTEGRRHKFGIYTDIGRVIRSNGAATDEAEAMII